MFYNTLDYVPIPTNQTTESEPHRPPPENNVWLSKNKSGKYRLDPLEIPAGDFQNDVTIVRPARGALLVYFPAMTRDCERDSEV